MSDARAWLEAAGLAKYVDRFEANDIGLDIVGDFSDDEWRAMGFSPGDLKRLHRAVGRSVEAPDVVGERTGNEAAGAGVAVADHELATSAWVRTPDDRRPVTLIFVDITGSTAMTGTMDPEQAHQVLYGAVQELAEAVEAHRGVVGHLMGDGLMAMFGVPESFEAHVREACACALEMQTRIRAYANRVTGSEDGIAVRVGVHSGDVVALRVGAGPGAGWDASGPALAMAARMEQSTAPGTVQLTAETYSLVSQWFEAEVVPAVTVKGFADAIEVVHLKRPRNSQQLAGSDGAFVGRRAEFAQIRAALTLCANEKLGHALMVRGEPGIGKTRLCSEANEVAKSLGFRTFETLVLDFGQGNRERPVPVMLTRLLALDIDADVDERKRVIKAALADGVIDESHLALLRSALDLPLDEMDAARLNITTGTERAVRFEEMLVALLERQAKDGPVLFVVEDLHWADPLTVSLVASLVRAAMTTAAVVLCTTRPLTQERQRAWESHCQGASSTLIELGPLRRAESEELIHGLGSMDEDYVALCIERSGGNPLFLTHLLLNRANRDRDFVPTSVQTIVSSSLAALEPQDRDAIRAAAILGQRFDLDAVRAMLERPNYDPGPLIQNRLVKRHQSSFLFAHALVLEGVLGSMLKPERARWHAVAAKWFTGRDERLEATHLVYANDARAPQACARAARSLLNSYRFSSALDVAELGLANDADGPTAGRLELLCGEAHMGQGDTEHAIGAFERAIEQTLDPEERSRCFLRLNLCYRTVGRMDDALAALDGAEPIARQHGITADLVEIGFRRGDTLGPVARLEEAQKAYDEASRHALASGDPELIGLAFGGQARLHTYLGRMRSVDRLIDEAVSRCDGPSQDRIVGSFMHLGGIASFWMASFARSEERCRSSIEKSMLIGDHRQAVVPHQTFALLAIERGHLEEARTQAAASVGLIERTGERRHSPILNACAVHIHLESGEPHAALERGKEGLEALLPSDRAFGALFLIGALARATAAVEPAQLGSVIANGDAIAAGRTFGYGILRYRLDAIEAALLAGDPEQALRQADLLETFTAVEPLPLPLLALRRCRQLAAFQRAVDEATREDARSSLAQLLEEIRGVGWTRAEGLVEQALS